MSVSIKITHQFIVTSKCFYTEPLFLVTVLFKHCKFMFLWGWKWCAALGVLLSLTLLGVQWLLQVFAQAGEPFFTLLMLQTAAVE